MDADQFFNAINNSADQELNRQLGFEERCCRAMLRLAKVQLNINAARQWARNHFDDDTLGFRWLNATFPRFPLLLASSKLRNTAGSKIGWTEIFGKGFAKLPWFSEYRNVVNANGWNIHQDRCALLFNAPHADKSFIMVLHNQPIQGTIVVEDPEERETPGVRVVCPFGHPRVVYVYESLSSFMTTVGADWAGDTCQPQD